MAAGRLHCARWLSNEELVKFIEHISGTCVYGKLSAVSWVTGYLSMACWLCAQLPQIITNYQNGSVEGVSLTFLLIWFAGDFTNFLGCVLTHQLPFQTLLSLYYLVIDTILASQFVYYTRRNHRLKARYPKGYVHHPHSHRSHSRLRRNNRLEPISSNNSLFDDHLSHSDDQGTAFLETHPPAEIPPEHIREPIAIRKDSSKVKSSRNFFSLGSLVSSSFVTGFSKAHAYPVGREVLEDLDVSTTTFASAANEIGIFIAWTCTCLYLCSRIPQLYKNYTRKSTSGISILLFLAALFGNTLYTISILTSPAARAPMGEGYAFIMKELPYLMGSAGTVSFDIVMLIQWFKYRKPRLSAYQAVSPHTPLFPARSPEFRAGLVSPLAIPHARKPRDVNRSEELVSECTPLSSDPVVILSSIDGKQGSPFYDAT